MKADQAAIYIPFDRGDIAMKEGDYVVRGLVADEISGAFTISDLKRKYRDCHRITSVDLMDNGSKHLQHYQVGAE